MIAKVALMKAGPNAKTACSSTQLFVGLKAGIEGLCAWYVRKYVSTSGSLNCKDSREVRNDVHDVIRER